jgi:hypothetical protein
MRTITLSDHTTSQILQLEAARAAEQRIKWSRYQEQLSHLNERRTRASKSIKDAWTNRRAWQLFKALFRWLAVRQQPAPRLLPIRQPDNQENAVAAGNQGEALVLGVLGRSLSHQWTVLKGYRNSKGETDLLAVGPDGIAAVEIKHLNGVIHCDRDRWWRDKYDQYGNLVERGLVIQDRGGRAPSRQVNEVADALEEFLSKRGIVRHIARIVVLSHPKSTYGTMSDLTVNWVCTVGDLDLPLACSAGGYKLRDAEIERIVSLVQKDHAFHDAAVRRK